MVVPLDSFFFPMTRVVQVIGNGGHSLVVRAVLRAQFKGQGLKILVFDDKFTMGFRDIPDPEDGETLCGVIDEVDPQIPAILAIGDNTTRAKIAKNLKAKGQKWCQAIHPSAIVDPLAQLGEGVMVGALAVIQPRAVIGDHAIINTGAIVEHHGRVGKFAHLAPGTKTTGRVTIGRGTLIGVGACILPQIEVGKWCTVGGGALVNRAVAHGSTVVGVPIRALPLSTVVHPKYDPWSRENQEKRLREEQEKKESTWKSSDLTIIFGT